MESGECIGKDCAPLFWLFSGGRGGKARFWLALTWTFRSTGSWTMQAGFAGPGSGGGVSDTIMSETSLSESNKVSVLSSGALET